MCDSATGRSFVFGGPLLEREEIAWVVRDQRQVWRRHCRGLGVMIIMNQAMEFATLGRGELRKLMTPTNNRKVGVYDAKRLVDCFHLDGACAVSQPHLHLGRRFRCAG